MYMYDRPSWTGEVYETECYFPTWINKENAAHVQALVDAHHALWGDERIGHADADPKRDAMHLRTAAPSSTSGPSPPTGVAIQGRYGIPCVGFGPGAESQAHAPNEITWKQDLVTCAALYAAVPGLYKEENKTADVSQFRRPARPTMTFSKSHRNCFMTFSQQMAKYRLYKRSRLSWTLLCRNISTS